MEEDHLNTRAVPFIVLSWYSYYYNLIFSSWCMFEAHMAQHRILVSYTYHTGITKKTLEIFSSLVFVYYFNTTYHTPTNCMYLVNANVQNTNFGFMTICQLLTLRIMYARKDSRTKKTINKTSFFFNSQIFHSSIMKFFYTIWGKLDKGFIMIQTYT